MTAAGATLPAESRDDPDAQATVTDYLDYTEYLPSDLTRALTLIRKLDETYHERTRKVHELTKEWARPAGRPASTTSDSQALRRDISYNLHHAIKARESAFGEAERLHEMVERYHNRLSGIKTKLLALPKPPSRDPSPIAKSPQMTRKTPARITLRLDGARNAASTGRAMEKERKRAHRNRRVTIPGEVLPPRDPDSPQEDSESEWDSLPPSPLPIPTSRVGGSRSRSHKRLKAAKVSKPPKDRLPRPPRQPGMGTNVHSQVAGISTSNALSMLPIPPPDAQKGSEHAPWMRLTEYEMALLRKRMKKNAIWTPSETMIRRELASAGRGPDHYRKQRNECEEVGGDFVDVDNIAESAPDKPLLPGEIRAESLGPVSESLSNRGMKLNEAKKQKREAMLEASRLETQQATKRIEDLGTNFKLLFDKPRAPSFGSPLTPRYSNGQSMSKEQTTNKKRKGRGDDSKNKGDVNSKKSKITDAEHVDLASTAASTQDIPRETGPRSEQKSSRKRSMGVTPAGNRIKTTTIPLASPGPTVPERASQRIQSITPAPKKDRPSLNQSTAARPRTSSLRSQRLSLTLRGPTSPFQTERPPRSSLRKTSLQTSTASPSTTLLHERPRRKSATPATPTTTTPVLTAAARRSKRPAPGAILQNGEGGAAVTVGRRQRPPRKDNGVQGTASIDIAGQRADAKGKASDLETHEQEAGEAIDPNEPRYCICGGVSWGSMVCCDNLNCEREWFHFDCVGLTETPSRRTKWYCPECKVKMSK